MKLPPLNSLVVMHWDDAHAGESTWLFPAEIDGKLKRIKTVGWLMKASRKSVTVAASTDGECFSDVTTVPRNCIVAIRKLGSSP